MRSDQTIVDHIKLSRIQILMLMISWLIRQYIFVHSVRWISFDHIKLPRNQKLMSMTFSLIWQYIFVQAYSVRWLGRAHKVDFLQQRMKLDMDPRCGARWTDKVRACWRESICRLLSSLLRIALTPSGGGRTVLANQQGLLAIGNHNSRLGRNLYPWLSPTLHVNGFEDIVGDGKEGLDGFIIVTFPILEMS
jgi:hypothetical protein